MSFKILSQGKTWVKQNIFCPSQTQVTISLLVNNQQFFPACFKQIISILRTRKYCSIFLFKLVLSVTEVHLRTIQYSCYDKNCDIFQQRVSAVSCKLQFGTTLFAIIPVESIQFLPYYFKCLFQNLTLSTTWENNFWWLFLPLCNTEHPKETLHVILFT